MPYDFASFLSRLAAYFEAGERDRMAKCYVTPISVYLGDKLMVLGSRAVAIEALAIVRAAMTARDMARAEARVDAAELPTSQFQRLFATWRYSNRAGGVIGQSRVRYVLEIPQSDDNPRVHLLHYLSTDFTDLAAQMLFTAPPETG